MFENAVARLLSRVFCFLAALSFAADAVTEPQATTALVETAQNDLRLQDAPTWRRLLHFRPGETKSEILSPDFFLDAGGNRSAERELAATLTAFNNPDDATAICRFPARFLWLSQYFDFGRSLGECTRLNTWAKTEKLRSISLILVSGYFGNPASTFGHSLLRINNADSTGRLGLLDMGINFGALVPANELAPVYIVRGLFGGYLAGFSDREYYSQDQTYSRTELRDMWEYELALSDFQQQLIVYHLFEIVGKKFQYYFLEENCAYRLAELIELALDRDLTSGFRTWYVPVELFHRLKAIEQKENRSILGDAKYIASDERLLYQAFLQLEPTAREASLEFIATDGKAELPDGLSDLERADMLNALISFYQYKTVNAKEGEGDHFQHLRNQLLRDRLSYPPRKQVLTVPVRRSPADGSRPSRIGVGVGDATGSGANVQLSFSAFHYDEIGNNTLEGSSLIVMDGRLGLTEDSTTYVHHLDLVRASKHTLHPFDLPGQSWFSWDLALGIKQQRLDCQDCTTGYANYGFGRTLAAGDTGQLHAKLFAEYMTREDAVILRPSLGYIFNASPRWAMQLAVARDFDVHNGERLWRASLLTRYSFGPDWEMRLAVDAESAGEFTREVSLGLFRRF